MLIEFSLKHPDGNVYTIEAEIQGDKPFETNAHLANSDLELVDTRWVEEVVVIDCFDTDVSEEVEIKDEWIWREVEIMESMG